MVQRAAQIVCANTVGLPRQTTIVTVTNVMALAKLACPSTVRQLSRHMLCDTRRRINHYLFNTNLERPIDTWGIPDSTKCRDIVGNRVVIEGQARRPIVIRMRLPPVSIIRRRPSNAVISPRLRTRNHKSRFINRGENPINLLQLRCSIEHIIQYRYFLPTSTTPQPSSEYCHDPPHQPDFLA